MDQRKGGGGGVGFKWEEGCVELLISWLVRCG